MKKINKIVSLLLVALTINFNAIMCVSAPIKVKEGTSVYITVDENGFINLTEAGQEIADKIYERHTFLTNWLTSLGVDPEVAAEDACKMEHAISSESFSAIKKYVADTH